MSRQHSRPYHYIYIPIYCDSFLSFLPLSICKCLWEWVWMIKNHVVHVVFFDYKSTCIVFRREIMKILAVIVWVLCKIHLPNVYRWEHVSILRSTCTMYQFQNTSTEGNLFSLQIDDISIYHKYACSIIYRSTTFLWWPNSKTKFFIASHWNFDFWGHKKLKHDQREITLNAWSLKRVEKNIHQYLNWLFSLYSFVLKNTSLFGTILFLCNLANTIMFLIDYRIHNSLIY